MMSLLLRFARCRIPGMHPAMDDLVAWAEQAPQHAGTHMHIRHCPRCRQRAGFICDAMQSAMAREPGAAASRMLDEVYQDLQIRMRAWSSLSGLTSAGVSRRLRNPANQRLARAIEIYVGHEAAARITSAVDHRQPDQYLAPTVKPLLSAFLGAKAAEALADRLVGNVV